MKTSQEGIDLIKRFESLRLEPYQDSAGVWTIGYGHTRTAFELMPKITEYQAEAFLKQDLEITEASLLKFNYLPQNKYDALVSLVFNIGFPNFAKSRLYKKIQNDYTDKEISDEWIEFRNSGGVYLRGLLLRRLAELSLYYKK